MDIKQALEAMENLGVTLNDYDTEALEVMCSYVRNLLHEGEVLQVCFHCWEKEANTGDELCVECRKAHDEARRMEGGI